MKYIVHVSEVNIRPNTGMGRVEWHWKKAFEDEGFTFIHIGPEEVGELRHKSLFPFKAYKYYKNLNITASAFIVHEPASGYFSKRGIPCFVESHGLERRYWEGMLNKSIPSETISLKTRLLYPLWRLYYADRGLAKADKLLLINNDDREFVKKKYKRNDKDIFVFRNGVNYHVETVEKNGKPFTILFNGSWIDRKGVGTFVKAAEILFDRGVDIRYLIIGAGKEEKVVLEDWPEKLRPFLKIVKKFTQEEESGFLSDSTLFILPSYFEGQPLSMLEAMAYGKCCITTNCCGQKDIIEDRKTGFLFSPGDHDELARLIQECYNNPLLVKSIGEQARENVKNLSWENVSKEVVQYVIQNIN